MRGVTRQTRTRDRMMSSRSAERLKCCIDCPDSRDRSRKECAVYHPDFVLRTSRVPNM